MTTDSQSPAKATTAILPGFGLPLTARTRLDSFRSGGRFPMALDNDEELPYEAPLLTIREYTMMDLMNRLTDKRKWAEKIYNEGIVAKLKGDILAAPNVDISEKMVDWCMEELKYKATLFERYDCIETLDGVFKSDTIISKKLRFALKMAVTPLEDVQEDEKDWHPDTHKKVLDLVHPSIYPLVYGQSRILSDGVCQLDDCIRRGREGQLELLASEKPGNVKRLGSEWSNRFQWLPSEFELPPGTQDVKAMSYINNIHPEQHKNLYTIIELVIAKAVSLWNLTLTCVMTDLNSKPRINMTGDGWQAATERPCYDGGSVDTYWTRHRAWAASRTIVQPEPGDFHPPEWGLHHQQQVSARRNQTPVDLREDFGRLQIIIKLANIQLTPKKPEYKGGSWHIEGMANESICATALYYYDCDNITESHLGLRQRVCNNNPGWGYGQDDHKAIQAIYGFKNEEQAIQELGKVMTRQGRLVTFPNVMQHRVHPFRLANDARPGHRKILALFLVDPHLRIISTANVPCQQRAWWQNESLNATVLEGTPAEGTDPGIELPEDFPVSIEKTKEQRLELMEERKDYSSNRGGGFEATRSFSLCEH